MSIDQDILNKLYKPNKVKDFTDILDTSPRPIKPVVTVEDAKQKYITRYFIRQVTDKNYVMEIDNTQYEQFSENPLYTTVEIKWKIVGKKESIKKSEYVIIPGVEEQNKNAVIDADLTFGGLRRYITNYLEYWFAEDV